MAYKENQRIALTRRLLQEGLLRLLAHEKLEQISVTALCKEAGINRATFYNHYTSPAALLAEMETQLASELDQIRYAPKSLDDIAYQLELSCAKMKEHADLIAILIRYHADRDIEDIIIKLTKYYDQNRLDVNKTELDPDSTHLVSAFLYAGSYHLVQEWILHNIDKTPKEIAQLIISIVSKDYL